MHKNQKKFFKVLAGIFLLLVVLSGFLLSVSEEDTLFYYTAGEIIADPKQYRTKQVRIMGLVEEGSNVLQGGSSMTFNITDGDTGKIAVLFTGVKPDMFREGQGVVAEGYLNEDNVFVSDYLMVKHTEEYKTPGDTDDMRKTMKSIMDSDS